MTRTVRPIRAARPRHRKAATPRNQPRWTARGHSLALQHQPAWEEWLKRYGLPPLREIPAGAEIIYDSATGGLSCPRNMRDDNGKLILAGNELAKERVTVVPPPPLAPFPPGLTVTVD